MSTYDAIVHWTDPILGIVAVLVTIALLVARFLRPTSTDEKLDRILALLGAIKQTEDRQMALIDDVATEVEENTNAVDSAIILLGQLSQMIADAGTDPVKLEAIRVALDTNSRRLAEAVVANTPAAQPS